MADKSHRTHRIVLFAFLGNADLTQAQRLIGVVMILRLEPWHGYRDKRPIHWEKIAELSGHDVAECMGAFDQLCGAGWFVRIENDGYAISPVCIEAAEVRQRAYLQRRREEARARAANKTTPGADATVPA